MPCLFLYSKMDCMPERRTRILRVGLIQLCFLSCLVLAACGRTQHLRQPVSEFRDAASSALPTARGYLINANRHERRARFDELAINNSGDVSSDTVAPTFSAEGIQARLEALAVFDSYLKRLGQLVDANPGASLKAEADALGQNLKSLGSTIGTIRGDSTISNYVGPVTAVVSAVSAMWAESVRDRALRNAITDASPDVSDLLRLLREDVRLCFDDRSELLLTRYNDLRVDYNTRREQMPVDARQKLLEQVRTAYDQYEEFVGTSPTHAFDDLVDAHDAMVKAVTNPKDNASLSSFVAAVDRLSARLEQAATILKAFETAGQ